MFAKHAIKVVQNVKELLLIVLIVMLIPPKLEMFANVMEIVSEILVVTAKIVLLYVGPVKIMKINVPVVQD